MCHHCLHDIYFPTQGSVGRILMEEAFIPETEGSWRGNPACQQHGKMSVICLHFMSHVVICPECITLLFHRDVVCADTDLYKHKFFTFLLAQVKKQCKLHYAHTADDVPQFSGLRCQPQHAWFGSWLGDGTREVSPLTGDICPWQSPCLSGAARGGRISPPRVAVFCSGAVEQD